MYGALTVLGLFLEMFMKRTDLKLDFALKNRDL